jgi:uncharacterized protein YkwD
MRKTILLGALAIAALATWAPAASACRGANVPAGAETADQARVAMTCMINRERRRQGLHGVRGDVALGIAAQTHSDDMASQDFFSHDGSDGTPASRAAAAGYMNGARHWGLGENLAFGTGWSGSPKAMVHDWMRSAEHRYILLQPQWRQVGVGVTMGSPMGPDGPGMATYTALFGYR